MRWGESGCGWSAWRRDCEAVSEWPILVERAPQDERVCGDRMKRLVILLFPALSLLGQQTAEAGSRVSRIEFVGNRFFSSSRLKSVMQTKESTWLRQGIYDPRVFGEDLRVIISLYYRYGFLEARIVDRRVDEDTKRGTVSLRIALDEGSPTFVSSVRFVGNRALPVTQLEKAVLLSPGKPMDRLALGDDEFRLVMLYADSGYIQTDIQGFFSMGTQGAEVTYSVEEGERTRIRRIELAGNRATDSGFLRRQLSVRPGELFSRRRLLRDEQHLYSLGIFSDAQFVPGDLSPDGRMVDLVLRVQERKKRWAGVGVGYGASDRLRLSAEWGHRNLSGRGQSLQGRALIGGQLLPRPRSVRRRLETVFHDPGVFGSKLDGSLAGYLEHENPPAVNYGWTRYGGSLRGANSSPGGLRFEGGTSLEWIRLRGVVESESLKTTRSVWGGLTFDNRDNIPSPRKGSLDRFEARLAGGRLFGGDNHFLEVSASSAWYWSTGEYVVFVFHALGGVVHSLSGSREVPIYERFFLGGANSVRAYAEDEMGVRDSHGFVLGGNYELLANSEVRFPLVRRLRGAVFLDVGNVWLEGQEGEGEGLKAGLGVGLRYHIPPVPARVDCGVKLNRRPGEAPGSVHFALGLPF